VPFRVRASDSSDKYFLVAHAPVRDLLLCAKHLFVAAIVAEARSDLVNEERSSAAGSRPLFSLALSGSFLCRP
jgi:hypothetical protein